MSLTNTKLKLRYLLDDYSRSLVPGDVFTYGSSNVFTLTESNVISITSVLKNDNEMGTSEVSFDSSTNKATVNLSLISGDTVEIQYTYYPNYSDTELQNAILGALVYLSINNYYDFTYDSTSDTIYPEITVREENLISTIGALLLRPNNTSYRLPEISIIVPKDLPLNEKISKTIAVFKHNTHGVFSIAG